MGHVISTTFFDSLFLRIKEHSIKKDTHTMVIHAQITRHTIVCMSFHLHCKKGECDFRTFSFTLILLYAYS